MSLLAIEQERELMEFIIEDFGIDLDRDQFSDAALHMFEDIAGFDSADESEIQPILSRLWRIYMTSTETKPVPTPKNQPQYDLAVVKGLEIIANGGSKADAARAIYEMIREEERDVVLRAFIVGATVTEKGSPTYYYNVSRKFAKNQNAKLKPVQESTRKKGKKEPDVTVSEPPVAS